MDFLFKRIFAFVEMMEGITFSKDLGGGTKYGICWKYDQELLMKLGYSTEESVCDLTREHAMLIHEQGYWIRFRLCRLSAMPCVAVAVYDMTFHEGKYGWMALQASINEILNLKIDVDGACGPQTLEAIDKLAKFCGADADTKMTDRNIATVIEKYKAMYYHQIYLDDLKAPELDKTLSPLRKYNSALRRLGRLNEF